MRWENDHPAGRRGVRFGAGGELTVKLAPLRSDEPLTISFWLRTPKDLLKNTLFEQTEKLDNTKAEDDNLPDKNLENEPKVGWKIDITSQGTVWFHLFDANGKNSLSQLLPETEALRPRAWQLVCVRYSGGQSTSSISILQRAGPCRPAMVRKSTSTRVNWRMYH